MDVRDFGNTDNRGSPELSTHTWLPIDYADGLVRVGVQSAIPHPETAKVLREADAESRPQGAARRPYARIAVHRRCVQAGIRSDEHQQLRRRYGSSIVGGGEICDDGWVASYFARLRSTIALSFAICRDIIARASALCWPASVSTCSRSRE